jgi:hypothetical protein
MQYKHRKSDAAVGTSGTPVADTVLSQQPWRDVASGQAMLDSCPYLSELSVITTASVLSSSELRPDTLGRLQTLVLYFLNLDFMQSGLLLQVLRLASQLHYVHLKVVQLYA